MSYEWFQNSDGLCNFESLSLFSLKDTKSGATLACIYPVRGDVDDGGQTYRWGAIGGWSGEANMLSEAKAQVEALEIIRRLK